MPKTNKSLFTIPPLFHSTDSRQSKFLTGYANEVGEAFRHMVPVKLVYFSYLVSSAYVLSHSVTRGSLAKHRQLAANQDSKQKTDSRSARSSSWEEVHPHSSPGKAFLDTLIWQGLASVIIPGLVINRTCAVSRVLLRRLLRRRMKWTVTFIGLGSIPFIIQPIDRYDDCSRSVMTSLAS